MKRTPKTPSNTEALLKAANLTDAEARFIVANYYDEQDRRKRADGQIRHMGDKADKVCAPFLQALADDHAVLEKEILKGLGRYAEQSPVGRWILEQHGFGPVLAGGFLAHLSDITQAPTVGHWWRFAGLDPTCKWEKGQKRPYNAQAKQFAFHAGECIKRTHNAADSFYGRIYEQRKAYLVEKNERLGFEAKAKEFKFKGTPTPENKKLIAEGKVPPFYIDRMACRYAVKMFLSHLHAVTYWNAYGKAPPKPFAIQHLGHVHEIKIPKIEMFPGLAEAYYGAPVKRAA